MIVCAKITSSGLHDAMKRNLEDSLLHWEDHFNKSNYEGNWTGLALRAVKGLHQTIIPGFTADDVFEDHPNMDFFPAVKTFLDTLQCTVRSVRLLNLAAGAVILPHCDHELSFEQGEARLHLPVITNSDVRFYVQEQRVIMQEGECWYINANLRHHVTNAGQTDRIHLVVDCVVNDWLKTQITSASVIRSAPDYSPEQLNNIIRELRLQHTITSGQLADELQQQLNHLSSTSL